MSWYNSADTQEALIRLLVAAVLGGIIGFERQRHGRPAGFRTHLLVSVASALLMVLAGQLQHRFTNPLYRIDPTRVAAGAITGIGFLGAGVIFRAGATVQGLTTAACLWMATAVGLAAGAGAYTPSVIAVCITIFALLALRYVERRTLQIMFRTISIASDSIMSEDEIKAVLDRHGLQINNIDYEADIAAGTSHYTISVAYDSIVRMAPLLSDLSALKGMRRVAIRV